MSRNSNEKTLKEAIDEMLGAYKLKSKLLETGLIANWEKVMGKTIASRTTDIYISGRKLFLRLNSSVVRQELSFAKEKIVALMNEEAGAEVIDDVVIL